MRCPNCLSDNTKVVDSRDVDDFRSVRRRRECEKCETRFTTYERVELANFLVVKKDEKRESYNRDKLISGILKACEKRPISKEQIDQIVSDMERKIQSEGEGEVTSKRIGDMVSRSLRKIDKVAYIRFASVYKSFEDLRSFEEELKDLKPKKRKKKGK